MKTNGQRKNKGDVKKNKKKKQKIKRMLLTSHFMFFHKLFNLTHCRSFIKFYMGKLLNNMNNRRNINIFRNKKKDFFN